MDIFRQHIEKIVSLTDDEFAVVMQYFLPKKFKKHQFLVQAGEAVLHDFFVVNGLVKAYHTDTEGKELILQFAMEQWWVSDYQAFHNQETATLNVTCIEDAEVLHISYDDREKLYAEVPKMQYFFMKKSNRGYIALQNRILLLLNSSPAERYEQFCKQYPGLLQRLPKMLIAAYLGVSRETLSRLNV
jgi:CRP-like cAMP-binding protein